MAGVSEHEWIEMLREAVERSAPGGRSDPGATSQEFADAMGISPGMASRKLTRAVRDGLVVVGYRETTTITGARRRTPVYRLVEPAP